MAMTEEERRELAEAIGARMDDGLAGVGGATRAALDEAGLTDPAEIGADVEGEELEAAVPAASAPSAADPAAPPEPPVRFPGVNIPVVPAAPPQRPMGAADNLAPRTGPAQTARVAPPAAPPSSAQMAAPAQPPLPVPPRNFAPGVTADLGAITSSPESMPDRSLRMADAQADAERRRAKRLTIAGAVLSGIGLTPFGAIVGGASNMVDDEGRRKSVGLREQIAARAEAMQKQQEEERRALLAQIEARQEQANRDRDFGLRQAALAARGDEFAAQQGLRTRSQDFREAQAELNRTAAERRARIISGQRVGPGGGGGDGGAPARPGGDVDVGGDIAGPDALVIQSIIDERSAQLAPAVEAEVERLRSQGVETTPEAVEWAMAANFFHGLSRKDQNRVRATYAMPRTTSSEAAASDREETTAAQLAETHRVPGWDRSADAPRLQGGELTRARNIASTYDSLVRLTRRMEQLAGEINALDASAASAGIFRQKTAEANQVHEQLFNQLREIGNYGVPTGNEIERIEALVPRLTSRQWWTGSAVPTFRAMRNTLGGLAQDQMRSLGYSRHVGGGRAARGGGQWRPVGRSGDYIVYENSRTGERRRRHR